MMSHDKSIYALPLRMSYECNLENLEVLEVNSRKRLIVLKEQSP